MNVLCHLPPPFLNQLAVVCPIAIGQSSPSTFRAVTTSHLWLNHSYQQWVQQYRFEGTGAVASGAESHGARAVGSTLVKAPQLSCSPPTSGAS